MDENKTISQKDWLLSGLGFAFILEYGVFGLLKGLEGSTLGWVVLAAAVVLIVHALRGGYKAITSATGARRTLFVAILSAAVFSFSALLLNV